jgi:hypothetical protein
MRVGFGLLSLLLAAAIVFYISFGGKNGGYEGAVLKQGQLAQQQASQISGHTMDDVPIEDTIKLDEVDSGGQFRRLKVISITAQTPMDTAYGLKPNDEITRVGDLGVSDNNDAGLAKALVYEAYSRNQPLVILRNGQEITLTPRTPLTFNHPDLFGAPGATVNPSAPVIPQGSSIPTH